MEIKQLQELYNTSDSNIKWAKHCLERMQERDISIMDVESCLQTGEIIEDYPDDFPHPSCLILDIQRKITYCILLLEQMVLFYFLSLPIIPARINLKKI